MHRARVLRRLPTAAGALTLASPGSLPADSLGAVSAPSQAGLGRAYPFTKVTDKKTLNVNFATIVEAPGPCGALGVQSLWGLGLDLVQETDCLGCPWPSASWIPKQEGRTRDHLPSWIINIYNYNRSYHSSKSDHNYITSDN